MSAELELPPLPPQAITPAVIMARTRRCSPCVPDRVWVVFCARVIVGRIGVLDI